MIEKCPFAIQFLGTYFIVIEQICECKCRPMDLFIMDIQKKSHLRVWMLKFWSKLLTEAFKVALWARLPGLSDLQKMCVGGSNCKPIEIEVSFCRLSVA